MFEDLIITEEDKENIENMNIKLFEEQSWVELFCLRGAICKKLFLNEEGILDPTIEVSKLKRVDTTLAYLKPLLEKKELKAGKWTYDEKTGRHPVVEYLGTAEETLQTIREEWLKADTNSKEWNVEFFTVFTLQENPWLVQENRSMRLKLNSCPVCGYNMGYEAWPEDKASSEVCPCCSYNEPYDLRLGYIDQKSPDIIAGHRWQWMQYGMPYEHPNDPEHPKPENWDPKEQLKNIGIDLIKSPLNTYCPVCGYDLGFEAWFNGHQSDAICPSCGVQFGYDDAFRLTDSKEGSPSATIVQGYNRLRNKWLQDGMKWWSTSNNKRRRKPENWDPKEQLKNIGIYLE